MRWRVGVTRQIAAAMWVFLWAQAASAGQEAFFEKKVRLSKELGATFVTVTEDLPPALWQFNPKDDPYPGWFIYRPGLLKLYPPKELQPYVDARYSEKIDGILAERCRILRKYGLKGTFNSNEPQTLPEAFFVSYPELRGPRVDQPNRSRTAWWAPSVDEPRVLGFYAAAIKSLLKACPEIENFNFLTSDSGSGFDWVPGLYPGLNGNTKWKDRPLEQRVSGFLINLQNAAADTGHHIAININPISPRQWMTPSLSPEVLSATIGLLPRGISIGGREGPDGRRIARLGRDGAFGGGGHEAFSPVVGIVIPSLDFSTREGAAASSPADKAPPRVAVELGDAATADFNFRLIKALRAHGSSNLVDRVASLRAFAASEVGEKNADDLMDIWSSLGRVKERLDVLDFGEMLQMGHVLNRWINRPMVPLPEELMPAERKDWMPFLFQAKGDEQALDLTDIQAMRMYEGWGAALLFQRAIETTAPQVLAASQRIARIAPGIADPEIRDFWELYAARLEAAYCLLQSAQHMVSYQAQLDRARALNLKPEENPPLGAKSDWSRTDIMELARAEIDTMVRLRQILQGTKQPILDTAARPDEQTIMKLGPNIAGEIKDKIDTMNRHWRDYDRLFTKPNP